MGVNEIKQEIIAVEGVKTSVSIPLVHTTSLDIIIVD